jgi:antitoxin component YwqK of YwqJK toxin-antitoxin module
MDSEMSKRTDPVKKSEMVDGITIKYHANGSTIWSKGTIVDGNPEGYWEWYRQDGTLKRSGFFERGEPVGDWTTYDAKGEIYKVTTRKPAVRQSGELDQNCPAEAGSKD